jgi:hypothetical protein
VTPDRVAARTPDGLTPFFPEPALHETDVPALIGRERFLILT